jgi:hypothetical protein
MVLTDTDCSSTGKDEIAPASISQHDVSSHESCGGLHNDALFSFLTFAL